MQHVDCTWCQAEIRLLDDRDLGVTNRSHFICSDCLIDLLPKKLLTDKESRQQQEKDGDRRMSERFPVYSHAYLMLHQLHHPRFFGAVILNISDSGMKLIMNDNFNPGEILTISFHGQQVIYKAVGEVIRSQRVDDREAFGFEVGIRFTAIHQELR